jgi:lysozyme
MREIPQAYFDLVKHFEGLSLTVYKDIAGRDTIYWGHLCKAGEVYNNTIEEGQMYLAQDSRLAFDTIDRLTSPVPNDNQYAAMGSFTFNEGIGAFGSSTLLRLHNKEDFMGAANQFLAWNKVHVNGKLVVSEPLTERRIAERALYLTSVE